MSDIVEFPRARKVAVLEFNPDDLPALPDGPFTVTVSNKDGKIYEAVFPDASGNLPPGTPILGTTRVADLMVNLLTGLLRVSSGRYVE